MADYTHYARWPQTYGGKPHDRGQVLKLRGLPNDESLKRLGYVAEIPKDTTLKECGKCGEKFVDEGMRNAHYETRHLQHSLTPEEEDDRIEREEKLLLETAPLNLDQTAASRGVTTPGRRGR
jgi:hypothetical protein